jgi:hypothetical protein
VGHRRPGHLFRSRRPLGQYVDKHLVLVDDQHARRLTHRRIGIGQGRVDAVHSRGCALRAESFLHILAPQFGPVVGVLGVVGHVEHDGGEGSLTPADSAQPVQAHEAPRSPICEPRRLVVLRRPRHPNRPDRNDRNDR